MWFCLNLLISQPSFLSAMHTHTQTCIQKGLEQCWRKPWSGCPYLRIQLGFFKRTINWATPPTERDRDDPRDPQGTRGPKKETSAILSLCREMQGPTLPSASHPACSGYCFYPVRDLTIKSALEVNVTEKKNKQIWWVCSDKYLNVLLVLTWLCPSLWLHPVFKSFLSWKRVNISASELW